MGLWVVAALALPQPAGAISPNDLDLSEFPPGSKVRAIAQQPNGEPLQLCARPTREKWMMLPGPPTVKWVKVPLKPKHDRGRYQPREGVDFIWVQIEIPGPPGSEWTVEGMECIKECPQGSSGTRCVENPKYGCPICVE